MYRTIFLWLLAAALIGCGKKENPTEPTPAIVHGTVSAEWVRTFFIISSVPESLIEVDVWLALRFTEPTYLTADSCRAWLFLDNGKAFSYPLREGFLANTYPNYDIHEWCWIERSNYPYNNLELSDSLAVPDSVWFRVQYTQNTERKQQVFKFTLADTVIYHHFYTHVKGMATSNVKIAQRGYCIAKVNKTGSRD